ALRGARVRSVHVTLASLLACLTLGLCACGPNSGTGTPTPTTPVPVQTTNVSPLPSSVPGPASNSQPDPAEAVDAAVQAAAAHLGSFGPGVGRYPGRQPAHRHRLAWGRVGLPGRA